MYGTINKMLQITGGILGSTALLALGPIIPIFIIIISITPAIIGVIIAIMVNTAKVNNKNILMNPIIENLRFYYHMFKANINLMNINYLKMCLNKLLIFTLLHTIQSKWNGILESIN